MGCYGKNDAAWKHPIFDSGAGADRRGHLGSVVGLNAGLVNLRQEPAQFKLPEPRDMRVVGEKTFVERDLGEARAQSHDLSFVRDSGAAEFAVDAGQKFEPDY